MCFPERPELDKSTQFKWSASKKQSLVKTVAFRQPSRLAHNHIHFAKALGKNVLTPAARTLQIVCKNQPPPRLYFGFSIFLVFRRLLFFAFFGVLSGDLGFNIDIHIHQFSVFLLRFGYWATNSGQWPLSTNFFLWFNLQLRHWLEHTGWKRSNHKLQFLVSHANSERFFHQWELWSTTL